MSTEKTPKARNWPCQRSRQVDKWRWVPRKHCNRVLSWEPTEHPDLHQFKTTRVLSNITWGFELGHTPQNPEAQSHPAGPRFFLSAFQLCQSEHAALCLYGSNMGRATTAILASYHNAEGPRESLLLLFPFKKISRSTFRNKQTLPLSHWPRILLHASS